MQVCAEVRALFSKKKMTFRLKQFFIKFTWENARAVAKLSKSQAARMSKMSWFGGMGLHDLAEEVQREVEEERETHHGVDG